MEQQQLNWDDVNNHTIFEKMKKILSLSGHEYECNVGTILSHIQEGVSKTCLSWGAAGYIEDEKSGVLIFGYKVKGSKEGYNILYEREYLVFNGINFEHLQQRDIEILQN